MCLAQRFFFLLGCGFHHFYLSQWWKWRKKKTELLVQNPFNLKRNFCSNNANPIIIFQVINFHTHTHTSGMCFSLLLSPPPSVSMAESLNNSKQTFFFFYYYFFSSSHLPPSIFFSLHEFICWRWTIRRGERNRNRVGNQSVLECYNLNELLP